MCDKSISENGGRLKSVSDYCKNPEMCNKAVDNDPALAFFAEFYKNQKICDEATNIYPSNIIFVSEWFMTDEMCDKPVNRCFW